MLAHEAELERLSRLTPAAADTAVVAGDPAYDRMLASRHLRDRYREALGIAPDQKLVTVTSTWWRNSLLGSWPSVFREILGSLDRDRYRVAGLLHPNIWHGHGPWQLHTWLADCLRAGLLLPPPAEGWQAVLLASDVIVGDHGATTVYGSCLDLPVLLATYPDDDVAPGSVGELLGRSAVRLNRHEPLDVQIERAHQNYRPGSLDEVAALVTSCPGESAARLRSLFYDLLHLPEPADGPVVPTLPVEAVASPPPPAEHASFVVCQPREPSRFGLRRYPADVSLDRSDSAAFADAVLTAHEHHPDDALRRRAAIVLSSLGDQHALTDVLRRHPQATVAAAAAANGSLLLTKSGQFLESTFADPEIAAAVLFDHLLREAIPHEATVSCGGKLLDGRYISVPQISA
ncbi:hypothetical protein ACFORO_10170 [Amycolatopsis halotolerans]|uniref:Uncharacterized protein n=1 Tax=Amycolatopsis halotolerans TaxID=330083 RepID=A0ABV7QF78_9PSEU